MIRVKQEVAKLLNEFGYLNCLETGTIRTYTEGHESTRHISEVIGFNGYLTSVDVEPSSIQVSKIICNNAKNVEWVLMDSIEFLKHCNDKYHFILLDSVNDPDHIFEEYKLAVKKLHMGGVIMVDDAGVNFEKESVNFLPTHTPKKGWSVNEFLKISNIDYDIVKGGHLGNQIFFKMTDDNFQKIDEIL